MEHDIRPKLYCSRCLEFAKCRYDGSVITSRMIRRLTDHADIAHDCPEAGIGLGIPRSPVKVYENEEGRHLYQTSTSLHFTDEMNDYIDGIMDNLGPVDGFILKAKSPSCGIDDVKIYHSKEKGTKKRMGSGFLGKRVQDNFSHLAVETEKRLIDDRIRDHFLTKLYTLARFRKVKERGKAKDLIEFHANHKFLLMAYDQETMRKMGKMVARQKEIGLEDTLNEYGNLLSGVLSKGISYTNHINVLMHCFGYVSSNLTDNEKNFFLDSLEMYRDDRTPLVALRAMMMAWILRYNVKYLEDQYYFDPYPADLLEEVDGKRERELWK